MRVHPALLLLVACSSPAKPNTSPPPTEAPKAPLPDKLTSEVLAADTPKTTVAGNAFIAPVGWTFAVRGKATIVTAPEGGSWLAIVDLEADSADRAVELAWAAVNRPMTYKVLVASD